MTKIVKISDWQQFSSIAEKLSSDGPEGPIIFRGQCNAEWHLTPSLARFLGKMSLDQEQCLLIEQNAQESFKRQAHLTAEFCTDIDPRDVLRWWEIMQHYNAPTRLIDWTKSPYVALYFAVEDLSDNDGAIYSFDAGHLTFVRTIRTERKGIDWAAHDFEKLRKSLDGEEYEKTIMVVGCPKPTDRMVAQQSSFTVCTEILAGHDAFANNIVFSGVHGGEGHSIVQKYIIPSQLKPKFLANLEMMNINANTLFPGIDGLGRSIKEAVGLRAMRMNGKI